MNPFPDSDQLLDDDQDIIVAFHDERLGVVLIISARTALRVTESVTPAYLQTLSAWLRANIAADAHPFSLN